MAQLHAFKSVCPLSGDHTHTHMSALHRPNVKVVKKRIEHLIEREYLARDEADQSTYKYLA